MVAGDDADRSPRGRRWHPEAVVLALDDQHLGRHDVELGQAARPRLRALSLRWLERKREAEDAHGARQVGRSAGDTRPRRAPADDERQLVEPAGAESLDDGEPARIEMGGGGRRAPTRDPVRLLDERDAQPRGKRYLLRLDEVLRRDPSAGTVPEHDDAARRTRLVNMSVCRAVESADDESRHALIVAVRPRHVTGSDSCVFTYRSFLPIPEFVDDLSEVLGSLLVEEKLLVPEQLDLALQFAESTGLPLDQIVVAEFAIPQPDISRLLAEMNGDADGARPHNAEAPDENIPLAPPLGFRIRRPIGQIFVDLGFITSDDRENALVVQRERGGLLGEILIEQGKLTRLELANALSEHWDSAASESAPTPPKELSPAEVSPTGEAAVHPDGLAVADLRRSIDEIDASRIADAEALQARIQEIDEALAALALGDDDEFRRATSDRLQELAGAIESVTRAASDVGNLSERLDALTGSTSELQTELQALAAHQADAEPDERVNELAQTIDGLSQTLEGRLQELADRIESAESGRTEAGNLSERLDALTGSTSELQTELQALAAHQADAEPDERVNELAQTINELTQTLDDRLTPLTTRLDALDKTHTKQAEATRAANDELHHRLDELTALRTADLEATQAARTQAEADNTRIEQTLRAELETLAARQADAEPDERVNELAQTINELTQTLDDRLTTLAAELRAETLDRTDEIATQLRAQTDEVGASVGALRATVDSSNAETRQHAQTWVEESRILTTRLDDLDKTHTKQAEATRAANDELHHRLDELTALRTADLEATQAARTQAEADNTRIEQTLRAELETLAARQADAEPDERVNELAQTIDGLSQTLEGRLQELADRIESAESGRTEAGNLSERLDALTGSTSELQTELQALAAHQADAEPDERVNELAQTIDGLSQTLEGRLQELADRIESAESGRTEAGNLSERLDALTGSTSELQTELQALAAHQADAEPDERVNELAQTINELTQTLDDRLTPLTTRLDALDKTHTKQAEATRAANDELHHRLDELTALRTADLEATQAARTQAEADNTRIEQTLVGGLAELVVRVDDLQLLLDSRSAQAGHILDVGQEAVAEASGARDAKESKKRSKREKSKKSKKSKN